MNLILPRNARSRTVTKIIHIFKYNSSPGFVEAHNKVYLQHQIIGKLVTCIITENPHLNKIACYCKDVQVDYAPDEQYTTFGGAVTEVWTSCSH